MQDALTTYRGRSLKKKKRRELTVRITRSDRVVEVSGSEPPVVAASAVGVDFLSTLGDLAAAAIVKRILPPKQCPACGAKLD